MHPNLLMMALLAAQAGAGDPGRPAWVDAIPGDSAILLGRRVQAELRLEPGDVAKVRAAWAEGEAAKKREQEKAAQGNLTRGEARVAANALKAARQDCDLAISRAIAPAQFARYKQVSLQMMGVMAFVSPEVVPILDLTDVQQESARGIARVTRARVREVERENDERDPAHRDRDARNEMLRKLEKVQAEGVALCVDLLDARQKALWAEMNGGRFSPIGP